MGVSAARVLLWDGGQSSGALGTHLALHKHGHVHEHVMQLTDAVLQLNDLTVPSLNLAEGLLRNAGVHDDLGTGAVGWDPGVCQRGWGPRKQEANCKSSWDGQWREQKVLEGEPEASSLAAALPHFLLGFY